MTLIPFRIDSFNICARRNLEHALARVELEAQKLRAIKITEDLDGQQRPVGPGDGEFMLAIANENAAATLRELLRLPSGSYGT